MKMSFTWIVHKGMDPYHHPLQMLKFPKVFKKIVSMIHDVNHFCTVWYNADNIIGFNIGSDSVTIEEKDDDVESVFQ